MHQHASLTVTDSTTQAIIGLIVSCILVVLVVYLTRYAPPKHDLNAISDPGVLQFFWLVGKEDSCHGHSHTIPDRLKKNLNGLPPELENLREAGLEIVVHGWLHVEQEESAGQQEPSESDVLLQERKSVV